MTYLKVVYIFVLAVAVGINATVAPSAQCAHLYGSFPGGILNATSLPSVNSACVTAINALTSAIRARGGPIAGSLPDINYYQSVCSSTCQSFYDLYSTCYSPQKADEFFGQYCGKFNATMTSCPVVHNDTAYLFAISIFTSSCIETTCTSSCKSAVVAADAYAGCCAADTINAAKVTCGLNPRASCSTIFSTPTAPSAQCAYLSAYFSGSFGGILNPLFLPSVNSGCVNAVNALRSVSESGPQAGNPDIKYYQNVCNSNCQSFYNLYSSCLSTQQADAYFGSLCGSYNGMYCPVVKNSTAYNNAVFATFASSSCSTDVCTSTCKTAVGSLNTLGGCCVANDILNALNVACGLNTVAPCSTIFSAAVTQGIGMLTVVFAAFLTVWL